MRKTVFTIILAATTSVCSFAQTAYDAWLFSENNYEGTARSVAMGNAFTALGGDLGAVSINPAGSAVAGYSQITLTPSLTFSTNTAVGVPYEGSTNPYFQRMMKSRQTCAGIPNVGFTFNFDTGRSSGLKSITAGFVLNQTNSWCEDVYANGTNNQTSFLAALASDATFEIAKLQNANGLQLNDRLSQLEQLLDPLQPAHLLQHLMMSNEHILLKFHHYDEYQHNSRMMNTKTPLLQRRHLQLKSLCHS